VAKVFVLGHRGMLGHVVARVFEADGYQVCVSDARFDGELAGGLLEQVRRSGCEVVVNCIGTTPERADARTLLLVNALLPQALAALGTGSLLIHASSDGVFSGRAGGYRIGQAPDAEDPYGLSKRLGDLCVELGRVVVFRTSIVGPDSKARSLLSWYLAQRDPVQGFVDQRWNGITSLSWGRCALRAARGEFSLGVHHLACAEPLSKARLLMAIREAFGAGPEIAPSPSGNPLDRTLEPTCRLADIQTQLVELFDWYRR